MNDKMRAEYRAVLEVVGFNDSMGLSEEPMTPQQWFEAGYMAGQAAQQPESEPVYQLYSNLAGAWDDVDRNTFEAQTHYKRRVLYSCPHPLENDVEYEEVENLRNEIQEIIGYTEFLDLQLHRIRSEQILGEGKFIPVNPTEDVLYALAEVDGYVRGDRDMPSLTRWEEYYRAVYAATPSITEKRAQPESEADVALYAYESVAEILEPHIQRDENPDGFLPASVTDSVQILLEYRLSAGPQPPAQVPDGFNSLAYNRKTGEWLYINHADEWHLCPCPIRPSAQVPEGFNIEKRGDDIRVEMLSGTDRRYVSAWVNKNDGFENTILYWLVHDLLRAAPPIAEKE